jgi:hypothetical protein
MIAGAFDRSIRMADGGCKRTYPRPATLGWASKAAFCHAPNSRVFHCTVAGDGTCAGRVTVKVAPLPGELLTSIFPPC